jgi:hypothetical protein
MAVTRLNSGSSFKSLVKADSFLAGNTAFYPGDYDSIATVNVGSGGASTISFTSIPSGYTHLQIRWYAQQLTNNTMLNVKVNSDTGTNYTIHSVNGNGTSVGANYATPVQFIRQLRAYGVSDKANNCSVGIIDIADYTNTNKYKTFRMVGGTDTGAGNGSAEFESGMWMSTSVITQLDLNATNNFTQYSSFALYGIK